MQRINLKIAPDLGEPDLSLVQVPHGRLNRAGWYLYKHSLEPADIIGRAPLEYNGYISKLVAWAYFNGLLTPSPGCTCSIRARICTSTICTSSAAISGTFPVISPRHQPGAEPAVRDPPALHLPEPGDGPVKPLGGAGDRVRCQCRRRLLLRPQPGVPGGIGGSGLSQLLERDPHPALRGEEAVVDALTTILGKMHQDAAAPR